MKTNSRSGTHTSKNSELSVDDACRIIEASARAGLTELKFRGLELHRNYSQEQYSYPVVEITDKQHIAQTEQSVLNDELRIREDQVRELQLTNPLQFEQMLANGELMSRDDAEENDDGSDDDLSE